MPVGADGKIALFQLRPGALVVDVVVGGRVVVVGGRVVVVGACVVVVVDGALTISVKEPVPPASSKKV